MFGKSRRKINNDLIEKPRIKLDFFAFFPVAFVIVVLAIIFLSFKFLHFGIIDVIYKVNFTYLNNNNVNATVDYEKFNDGVMRLTNDGLSFADKYGNVKFSSTYTINDPIYKCSDDKFLVASKNENLFILFDDSGEIYRQTINTKIQKIEISNDGKAYILSIDDNYSYISIYDSFGKLISCILRTEFSNDGIAMDMSLNKDGNIMLVSYAYYNNSNIRSKVIYYYFDGENIVDKMILSDDFDGSYIGRVKFFGNNKSVIVCDNKIMFMSLENNQIVKEKVFEVESNIDKISINNNYFAYITFDNKMVLYNSCGKKLFSKNIDSDFEDFYLSENYIVFVNKNNVKIYNTIGICILNKDLEYDIELIINKKSSLIKELYVCYIDSFERVRFY